MYPSVAAAEAERQHAERLMAVHQANLKTQQTSLEAHNRFLHLAERLVAVLQANLKTHQTSLEVHNRFLKLAERLIAAHQANLTTQQTSLEVHKRFLDLGPITRLSVQVRRPATLAPRGTAPEVDRPTEETDRPLAPRGPQSVDGGSSEEREFPVVPRRLQTGQGTASDGSDEPLAPPKARSNNNKRKKSSRRPTASKKRKTASGEGESHQSSSFLPRGPLIDKKKKPEKELSILATPPSVHPAPQYPAVGLVRVAPNAEASKRRLSISNPPQSPTLSSNSRSSPSTLAGASRSSYSRRSTPALPPRYESTYTTPTTSPQSQSLAQIDDELLNDDQVMNYDEARCDSKSENYHEPKNAKSYCLVM
ncbi:hypothetical protein HDU89_003981 [Geranomyces variabilis]|nr:hypothetical protein HDU89_003981 [Geranomyces variabilis]